MKKLIAFLSMCVFAVACAEPKTIDGQTYQPYGLLDSGENKASGIQYQVSTGNVIWGVLLLETVIAPILLWGYALYQPVGKKPVMKPAGADVGQ